jgi:hypothetical protein
MVVHFYNPSYLGSKSRRIKSLRPARDKLVRDLSKKQNTKMERTSSTEKINK